MRSSVAYDSGAAGKSIVELLQSGDVEDRGGVILRFRTKDGGSSFAPLALHTRDGVELHLAGQAEAAAFLDALRALMAAHVTHPAADLDEDDDTQVLSAPEVTRLGYDVT